MVNRIFVIFFIFLLCSYPLDAAFHDVFEEDKDSQKLALKILSDKYHALAKWFGYQRTKKDWIPFDDGLAHCALDMAFAYTDWLHELRSDNPDLIRIDAIKKRLKKAREGDFLPANYKELPIKEVWEKNGPEKSYKVLKAFTKATRPDLPWPGNIYDHSILKTLYESKAAKYLLLSTLPKKGEDFMNQCLAKVKRYESLANEEHSKIPKIIESPELQRKNEVITSEMRKSGEYDSGWILVSDDDKPPAAEQVKPARQRVPRERSVNTLRSKANDFTTYKDVADAIKFVKPHLNAEQLNSINYLMNECGMTEAEAYAAYFIN